MKIKIPVVILIPILIAIVLLCTKCAKKEENTIKNKENEEVIAISMGEWDGEKYNNNFFNFKFNVSENWNKYSDDEIAKLMNIELNELENIKGNPSNIHDLAQKQEVYLMAANNLSTGAKIMIMFRNVSLDITEENYLNNLKEQLEQDRTMEYEISRIATEEISGEEYKTLNAKIIDFAMTQTYYVRKQEDYIICIIMATMQDGESKQILKYFE